MHFVYTIHAICCFLEYLDILYKHYYISICMFPAHIPDGKFSQSEEIIIEKIRQLGAWNGRRQKEPCFRIGQQFKLEVQINILYIPITDQWTTV